MKNIYHKTIKAAGLCLISVILYSCNTQSKREQFVAVQAKEVPTVDGLDKDACWQQAKWYPIDQLWLGKPLTKGDFEGRYKVVWSDKDNKLYMLVEVKDDVLMDVHKDPLAFYWDDDCLEVFLDEDNSGGNHQYSHNAFAYHIATDYKVVDINPNKDETFYNDHVEVKRSQQGDTYVWELAITVYNDRYKDGAADNPKVSLKKGKKLGFAVAYCDNDRSKERENFIGSVEIKGKDKNRGWIDAGVFGELELK
ncbi:sugar-binding protein [marine bacterium AO1-C]|nr:sugar-binding protein [marine bacterium AO1-C]